MPQKPQILTNPLTNRGTAFTHEERAQLGLVGRLPAAVETLDQQAARAYKQISEYETDLEKYIYLDQLQNRNEVLYYRVITDHLAEMLPIVYGPPSARRLKNGAATTANRARCIYRSTAPKTCALRLSNGLWPRGY